MYLSFLQLLLLSCVGLQEQEPLPRNAQSRNNIGLSFSFVVFSSRLSTYPPGEAFSVLFPPPTDFLRNSVFSLTPLSAVSTPTDPPCHLCLLTSSFHHRYTGLGALLRHLRCFSSFIRTSITVQVNNGQKNQLRRPLRILPVYRYLIIHVVSPADPDSSSVVSPLPSQLVFPEANFTV